MKKFPMLISVVIPNSVTSIGKVAFAECSKLATIIIPNTPTRITAPTVAPQPTITECYYLSGRRTSQTQRGVNIIKMSDATTKKML